MKFQAVRVGMVFGRWRVTARAMSRRSPGGTYFSYFHCECICGGKSEVRGRNLLNGTSTSCGCLRKEKTTTEIGMRFDRWVVTSEQFLREKTLGDARYFVCCSCDCGTSTEVLVKNLTRGISKSCGCLQRQRASETHHRHGREPSVLYGRWVNMRKRCSDPKNKRYADYGGRGIAVCKEWEKFEKFRDWALMNGYAEELILDRRDNDKGYSPDNCRWVDIFVSSRNTRATVVVEWKGIKVALRDLAEMFDIDPYLAYLRYHRGWSLKSSLGLQPKKARTP